MRGYVYRAWMPNGKVRVVRLAFKARGASTITLCTRHPCVAFSQLVSRADVADSPGEALRAFMQRCEAEVARLESDTAEARKRTDAARYCRIPTHEECDT